MTRITRRSFHALLGSVSGALGGAWIGPQLALGASPQNSLYRIRFRYHLAANVVSFWARVVPQSQPADVPFVQQFSTSSTFDSVFRTESFSATQRDEHIVRWTVVLDPQVIGKDVTVYTRLLDGKGTLLGKTWKLKGT